jgi:hypothetical protein
MVRDEDSTCTRKECAGRRRVYENKVDLELEPVEAMGRETVM